MSVERVLAEVAMERRRQDEKWGEQNHQPVEWLSILGEEFGEVCRAAYEAYFNGASLADYRTELIQVAAVAHLSLTSRCQGVAMVEALDRDSDDLTWLGTAPALTESGRAHKEWE